MLDKAMTAIKQGWVPVKTTVAPSAMYKHSFGLQTAAKETDNNTHVLQKNVRVNIAQDEDDKSDDSEEDQLAEQRHNDQMRKSYSRGFNHK